MPAMMRAATVHEKAFLIAAVGELTKLRIAPPADEFEVLFERFAQTVFVRGYVAWHM
jgi:hypothetical protein